MWGAGRRSEAGLHGETSQRRSASGHGQSSPSLGLCRGEPRQALLAVGGRSVLASPVTAWVHFCALQGRDELDHHADWCRSLLARPLGTNITAQAGFPQNAAQSTPNQHRGACDQRPSECPVWAASRPIKATPRTGYSLPGSST